MVHSSKLKASEKVSVISTLKNEGKGVDKLLSSLLTQSRKPDEVIIVDGGSTDQTFEKLQKWKIKFNKEKIKFKIIKKDKANIAEGRNIAIENANYNLIASIDGGCIAEKNWLKNLTNKGGDVVAGNFLPLSRNLSEEIQSIFVKRSTDKNPSSRSILFKKSMWKKVKGYPTNLYTGEDTLFNANMEKAGAKFVVADDAIVFWGMRSSLKKWLRQFFLYGYGDGKAGLNFKTTYGKKVAFLVLLAYSYFGVSLIYPGSVFLPFIIGAIIGLTKKTSVSGFLAGILLPIRYLAYILGLHTGILRF
ncbi:MAG: glycosyltransferase [Candidatus Altiarchaeota archaeon]|nr:glycosyltransferase [Candidatus Altiarchaeota archaeon]